MAKKVYRNPGAALRAAQRKLGGRLAFYDGTPVLHIVEKGLSGQLIDTYLSPEQAADRAELRYFPKY